MAMKRWVIGSPDRECAKAMSEELGVDAFAGLVACNRGITDSSELELLLCNEPILCDPYELADISLAADCVNDAIKSGVKIAVFGDYDCDGVVSTAIMFDYLKSRNADVIYYIPDRVSEGYGMNNYAVDELKKHGVGFIITVDNGISCADEVAYAASLGINTVVCDHHIPPEKLPNALAVVDPHRTDCMSSFKEICGAAVAFKLVCAIEDKTAEEMLPRYADLLAVATIGDVMPLINENRSVVKAGIGCIKHSARVGVNALINVAGFNRTDINAANISFGIVPRINAAGRMGDASRAVELLLSSDISSALSLANEMDEDNRTRQQYEKDIFKSADEIISENGYMHNRVIIVAGENWHCGVVGIVASRIAEKYGRPALVLTKEGEVYHGSGRSIKGFNLYDAIYDCKDLLIKYGGHELAAGVSVESGKIDEFRKRINAYAKNLTPCVPEINIDFKLNPKGMSVDMAFAVKCLEPFGNGFEAPVFGLFGVKLERIMPIGQGKHLKLLFSKEGSAVMCLLFSVTPDKFCFDVGDTLDLALTLDANYFRDEYSLSVIIRAIRPSSINQDKYFDELFLFDDFMSGYYEGDSSLLPDRSQIGEIYRFIKGGPRLSEGIKYRFFETLGYAKTAVALTVLNELGLISCLGGVYSVNENAPKRELTESFTYSKLLKG